MKNYSTYYKKIIWVIGLFILITISIDWKIEMKQTAQEEFNIVPFIWFEMMNSILVGLYISLLFVQKWSIKINHSLLWCVAVPCLLFLFIYPTFSTLGSYQISLENFLSNSILAWLFMSSMYSQIIIGITTGVTLTLSLFSHHSKDK